MIAIARLALRLSPAALAFLGHPAAAAERNVYIGSFDTIRVQGPYEVTVGAGSPGGTVSGERAAIDAVEVRLDGTTLVVRPMLARFSDRPREPAEPVRVTLSTPNLVSASVIGSSRLSVARMQGQRVDLSVSGTGAIAAVGVDAARAIATVIGSGTVTLAGRAASARLLSNGTGTVDADELAAEELFVRLDGPGEIRGRARYTAQVSNTGLGRVSIAGAAKCKVTADAGGPVSCGR